MLTDVLDMVNVYWCLKETGNLLAGHMIRDYFECGLWDREKKTQIHKRLSNGKKLKMVENYEKLMIYADYGMSGKCRSVKHRTLQDKL